MQNKLLQETNVAWFYTVKIVAKRTDVEGHVACFEIKGLCDKNGTNNVVTIGTPKFTPLFSWNVEILTFV